MFFTHAGRVVALLLLIGGVVRIAVGLAVATGTFVEPEPGFILGAKTSGQWIDRGILYLLISIGFGVVTDISYSVAKLRRALTEESRVQGAS